MSENRQKRIAKAFSGEPEKAPKKSAGKKRVTAPDQDDGDSEIIKNFSTTGEKQTKTDNLKYKKLELHQQILLRPDTYIGSVKSVVPEKPVYVLDTNGKIVADSFPVNDGLLRLFIEVLSNSIDNVWRSVEFGIPVKYIKVEITSKSIKVWNDGRNIPCGKHDESDTYIPEMIFGQLLTSSNYDDSEERKTSGKNGFGVKLCNMFSTKFTVDIYNAQEKVKYTQEWTDNMFNKSNPVVSQKGFPKTIDEGKNGYTSVEFFPDFKRFGCTEFSSEMIALMKKYAIDAAMTVHFNKVQLHLNSEQIKIDSIQSYLGYYFQEMPQFMLFESSDSKVVIAECDEFTQISFVNGINTRDGGVHVDGWCEAVFRPIIQKLNNPKKGIKLDMRDIKKYFFVFVFATLDKPAFDSQSKNKLNSPQVKTEVKPAQLAKLLKWDFVKSIEEGQKSKELQGLKDTERKRGTVRVEGLDDANFASNSKYDCSLFVSEGLSAKTYIVQGLKYGVKIDNNTYKGHDTIGILPIRGKFLNVKNAGIKTLKDNKEVNSIVQAIGLQIGVDYSKKENYDKLRYKKLVVATDADVDGFHITGLLFNFFQTLFPTLVKTQKFFYFMRVPILKITQKNSLMNFYYQRQAEKYIKENSVKKEHIKYFKGLGTANQKDVKEDFGRRVAQVVYDSEADKMMENIFSKDETEYRKNWIQEYKPSDVYPTVKDYEIEEITVSNFLNNEMINFSIDDCHRSIPHILDGFKESQRKVIYAAFKRNLRYSGQSLKVAQFCAYTAEVSNYHHGEMNLFDTVTKMAQRFVGSNNIPLLFNDGQFGSKLELGKDAANGRYIFTKLDMLTRLIFREVDDAYLQDREDDGDIVEKEYYLPIIPMILVNGVLGAIGTGFSSSIQPHNPLDIVAWIRAWLSDAKTPGIDPWYRGFSGNVQVESKTVTTTGVITRVKDNVYKITEIPIGRRMMSIARYKEMLEELKEEGYIKQIKDNSSDNTIDFTISLANSGEPDLKKLCLQDTSSLNNMVLFDSNNRLKRYESVDEILTEFCEKRLGLYEIRKTGEIKKLKEHLRILNDKIKFIEAVLNGKLVLKGKTDEQLDMELKALGLTKVDSSYDFVLSMQIKSMTDKRVQELKSQRDAREAELKTLETTPVKRLWTNELDEFVAEYTKWTKAGKAAEA
jgi:DNA topoisomerase-2